MGKLMYALLLVFGIELVLFLFGGNTYERTSLFSLMFNLSSITSSSLFSIFKAALLGIAGSAIIAGFFYNINVYGLFALIASTILSFILSIGNFWAFINSQLNSIMVSETNSALIATLIVSPIAIAYLIIATDYARGTD